MNVQVVSEVVFKGLAHRSRSDARAALENSKIKLSSVFRTAKEHVTSILLTFNKA